MIDQSDLKRQDVKRFYVKYTKEQPLGYKLEKLGEQNNPKAPVEVAQDESQEVSEKENMNCCEEA